MLVDWLVWLPLLLLGVVAWVSWRSIPAIAYLGLLAYAEGKTGQSPGKYAVGVRVLRWEDGQTLGVGMAIWRMVCRAPLARPST